MNEDLLRETIHRTETIYSANVDEPYVSAFLSDINMNHWRREA